MPYQHSDLLAGFLQAEKVTIVAGDDLTKRETEAEEIAEPHGGDLTRLE